LPTTQAALVTEAWRAMTASAAAVAMTEADRALEHVVLLGRRVRHVQLKQAAQVDDKLCAVASSEAVTLC
jgi:hypothetical protein